MHILILALAFIGVFAPIAPTVVVAAADIVSVRHALNELIRSMNVQSEYVSASLGEMIASIEKINIRIADTSNKMTAFEQRIICQPGYTLVNTTCVDTDECSSMTHTCGNCVCTNTLGSFTCAANSSMIMSTVLDPRTGARVCMNDLCIGVNCGTDPAARCSGGTCTCSSGLVFVNATAGCVCSTATAKRIGTSTTCLVMKAAKTAATNQTTCAVLLSGHLMCWGLGAPVQSLVPTYVQLPAAVSTISGKGSVYTMSLTDNRTVIWGGTYTAPYVLPNVTSIKTVTTNNGYCVISPTYDLRCWGSNPLWTPGAVITTGVIDVAASSEILVVTFANRTVYFAGNNSNNVVSTNQGGFVPRFIAIQSNSQSDRFIKIASSTFDICKIRTDGSVICHGQCLSFLCTNGIIPFITGPLTNMINHISFGFNELVATRSDNLVIRGRYSDDHFDSAVVCGSPALMISSGEYHHCMPLADGGVCCWGQGVNGELGNANTANSNTPVRSQFFG